MSDVNENKVKLLIHRVGLKHNLQDAVINKIINSQYKFVRETITNLDVENITTEEEFNKLKTNFMFMYIGKLYTNFSIFNKYKKQTEGLKNYHKNKQIEE